MMCYDVIEHSIIRIYESEVVLCRVRGVGGDHRRGYVVGALGVLGGHARAGGGTPTPTVTPTTLLDEEGDGEKEKKEIPPDCSLPGYSGYPECHGYVPPTSTPEPTSTVTPCRPPHCYDDRPTARPTATPTATARPTATATPTNTATPTKTVQGAGARPRLRPPTRQPSRLRHAEGQEAEVPRKVSTLAGRPLRRAHLRLLTMMTTTQPPRRRHADQAAVGD